MARPARRLLTFAQCQAARARLGWSQQELSDRTMVSLLAIAEFESGKRFPHPQMRWDLHDAFRAAGIEFIEDAPGVRMAAAPGGPA